MNYTEDSYRTMLHHFRTNDLQSLLTTFGWNRTGRKNELKERALDLLRNRPPGFHYQAYLGKIIEIYHTIQSEVPNNDMLRNMMQNQQQQMMMQVQQQRMFQHPQYHQQPMHMARSGIPQIMPQFQRGMYGNNYSGNSNIQYSYQPSSSHYMIHQMPNNQQFNIITPDPVRYNVNVLPSGNNQVQTPATNSLTNIRFKKLPFYEVVGEIMKPVYLHGNERCTLQNIPKGMKEVTYKLILIPDHVNEIAMNRDISNGKNEYLYQLQMRICLLEPGVFEINDYLPISLHVRVNGKGCPLPPTPPNIRPGTESRRTPRPINITHLIKLNPSIPNMVNVNWIPDGKNYIIGIYLVKKLSSDTLLQKLKNKETCKSEETKNYIIQKSVDVDPDLATTSYRFSLLCPLGKMRMKIPAKSIKCSHLQCFDAEIFILMNEKKPTWMCPTCNKPCLYDDIQIQSYFLDIVTNPTLTETCKEIEILTDGTWKMFNENKDVYMANVSDKEIPIDSVDLDDSDDGNDVCAIQIKKECKSESSKESENLKSSFVDLTLSDEDNPPEKRDKHGNEAMAAEARRSITTKNVKPQTQVQPQQAVTSSEQGGVVVVDISSRSPPINSTPSFSTK